MSKIINFSDSKFWIVSPIITQNVPFWIFTRPNFYFFTSSKVTTSSYFCLLCYLLTLFENYSKYRIWFYLILAFSTNCCLIKSDMSGNAIWPQAAYFQNFAKMDNCWHFLLTFLHSKCRHSSLRSQCWMRLFLWFSNTVGLLELIISKRAERVLKSDAKFKEECIIFPSVLWFICLKTKYGVVLQAKIALKPPAIFFIIIQKLQTNRTIKNDYFSWSVSEELRRDENRDSIKEGKKTWNHLALISFCLAFN